MSGGASLLLGGCGFQPRSPIQLAGKRVALLNFQPRSALAQAIAQALRDGGATIAAAPEQADVVVRALNEEHSRSAVSMTAAGQVRELRLRTLLRWQFEGPDGRPLSVPAELRLEREISYGETYALGKQQEEREMENDVNREIARQLARRLAALSALPVAPGLTAETTSASAATLASPAASGGPR